MNHTIKGVGCDITNVARIAALLKNTKFLQKVYTEYEQAYISVKGEQTAAGLWAAKEAVSKALGTGFVGFQMKDIEIQHDANGSPKILLHNGAEKRAEEIGAEKLHISISHETTEAFAFTVLE